MNTKEALNDDKATQHFCRTLRFSANMAKLETNYSTILMVTIQQNVQMAASIQKMQQELTQLGQQMIIMTATAATYQPAQP